MSTAPAAVAAIAVLSVAGLLPALVLVGPRLVIVPLLPIVGAVIASLAATLYTAVGGTFIGWFAALAIMGALVIAVSWLHFPDRRPRCVGHRRCLYLLPAWSGHAHGGLRCPRPVAHAGRMVPPTPSAAAHQ